MKVARWALVAIAMSAAPAFAAEGSAEDGQIKASTCFGCHGIPLYNNAYPTYRVPKIGGMPAAYIESALKAYRSGERQHPTMRAQAQPMSDQDIADIAAFISGAPPR
jgi:cytochrome c553